jgi:hypothetical protein
MLTAEPKLMFNVGVLEQEERMLETSK